MRALDEKKAIGLDIRHVGLETRRPVIDESTHYLYDLNHPRNPRNAGINGGLLFAYSALYQKYNMLERDARLDILKPAAREDQFGEFAFWAGVDYAVDKMTRLLEMKIERGIWGTSEDRAQMELLKTADMKRGYEIVPGRN
jgi:hypothetical protein